MGYLLFSKINLTVCLVHINNDKIANRQENPIIYLMFAVLWVNQGKCRLFVLYVWETLGQCSVS